MDQGFVDQAYAAAKAADAATLSGDFSRASRLHVDAADLFAQAATANPHNPATQVLNALASQHRTRAAFLQSGRARVGRPVSSSVQSPTASRLENVDDALVKATAHIIKSLEGLARDPSESFYLVGATDDTTDTAKRMRTIVMQEMQALAKDLKKSK